MVFITGASSGIGEACARAFAARNRPLWLAARRIERLQELAQELKTRFAIEVKTSCLDVIDRKTVEKFFQDNQSDITRVTILVNNAGLTQGLDPIQSGSLDDWDLTVDTNLKGLLYVTHGFLPHFARRGEGHVINIGSVASRWVYPKGNVYCATKRAVSALTEGMRLDLHGTGVRVSEISPGMVETEFSLVRFKGDQERAASVYKNFRVLTTNDIAETVVWTAERPAHVNIQEIVIYPTDQASTTLFHRKEKT
ncbi:MAG: SDR family NAD(P)-dependent oxidoreductase [Deltaproteobacteria bacterium]|nr:SDR family NAD(P)-dependent oxidoreductase [Deltaproteobacteria bacterium]